MPRPWANPIMPPICAACWSPDPGRRGPASHPSCCVQGVAQGGAGGPVGLGSRPEGPIAEHYLRGRTAECGILPAVDFRDRTGNNRGLLRQTGFERTADRRGRSWKDRHDD